MQANLNHPMINMTRHLIFLVLVGYLLSPFGGECQTSSYSVTVNISGRVDTSDIAVKDIYTLFKSYLEARPDSIYDNPYWNKKEKKERLTGNPAIYYTPLYEYKVSPKVIFNLWKPFVLSIERVSDDKYKMRIALIKDEMEPDKILTILNLNAIKEEGRWVLENTFHDIVASWVTVHYKYINYSYPKSHVFNEELAKRSIAYCDSIKNVLGINANDTFTYFVCDNPDEMGLLFGYEYYYLNYTTGLTSKWLNQIYSAKGNEFYPHEFMHIILKGIGNDTRNYLVEEGLACFLGEFNTMKYRNRILNLAKDYEAHKPTFDLEHLLLNTTEHNAYQTAYPTGSVIAEIIYDLKGYPGIVKLCEADTRKSEDILKEVCNISGLNKTQFERKFREKLQAYESVK